MENNQISQHQKNCIKDVLRGLRVLQAGVDALDEAYTDTAADLNAIQPNVMRQVVPASLDDWSRHIDTAIDHWEHLLNRPERYTQQEQHPGFTIVWWQEAVMAGDTELGYHEWVHHRLSEEPGEHE